MAPENSHLMESTQSSDVKIHPLTYRYALAKREDEDTLLQRKVRRTLLPYLVRDRSLAVGLSDTQGPRNPEVKYASRRQEPAEYERIYSVKTTPRSVTVPKRRL